MGTHLPAPYENVPDDDLASASLATVAAAVGVVTAITIGSRAWAQFGIAMEAIDDGARASQTEVAFLVTTVGWGAGAVFLVLGAIALMLRRGRGMLAFGALISLATTLIARYAFEWFTTDRPVPNAPMYYGGVAVLLLVMVPAAGRWAKRRSTVIESPSPQFSASTVIAPAAPMRHR